jgi:two-component system alkaline phosphatase synthesis response regulator PhoP
MRTYTILIADDSKIMRDMLRMILEKAGYHLIFAVDGQEAVEKAASEGPDLVIIDGLLPKLHGFLACKAIKEQEDAPKVVLLTGVYKKPSYRWEVKRDFRADELLIKPVGPKELLACVEKLLGRGSELVGSPQAYVTQQLVPPTDFEICDSQISPRRPALDAVA